MANILQSSFFFLFFFISKTEERTVQDSVSNYPILELFLVSINIVGFTLEFFFVGSKKEILHYGFGGKDLPIPRDGQRFTNEEVSEIDRIPFFFFHMRYVVSNHHHHDYSVPS